MAMQKNKSMLTPLILLNGFVKYAVLGLGITKFAAYDSSMLRAIYVISHPIILGCLVLYSICFTNLGQKEFTFISLNVSLPILFSKLSTFPIQTQNFFNLWVVLTPIMILILGFRIDYAEHKLWEKRWNSKSLIWQLGMIIFCSAILVVAIAGFLIPGDPSFCKGCTTNSMLGLLVIYGLLMPMSIGLLIAGIIRLSILFANSLRRK
jgi:hypothetical protein